MQDIVDTAVASGQFTTLAKALQVAGLVDTLKGAGPFTVFAPTDEAFALIPSVTINDLLKPENRDQLVALLTYHVASGRLLSADLDGAMSVPTLEGEDLAVSSEDGSVMVDDAEVTKADIECSNGVIHVIDQVLMPGMEGEEEEEEAVV